MGKITKVSPFVGYAKSNEQTEKKKLRDVFVKGDIYFNSGDLLKIDHEGFVYFQDRIGDTFRLGIHIADCGDCIYLTFI